MSALLLLAALWTTLVLARGTPVARWLHRWAVEAPARRLMAVQRATVIALALAATLILASWVAGGDAPRILAMVLPEAATWLATIEVGTLVDVAVAAIAARSALRHAPVRVILSRLGRPRSRRTRLAEKRDAPANDDEDGARLAA